MSLGTIPEDVRRFVVTSIPSVPHLEAILLLRDRSSGGWEAREVAQRLYMPEKSAVKVLSELVEAGIVAVTEGAAAPYRYAPGSPELAALIDRVADTYSHDLIGVTELIHSATGRKAQFFADAFNLRKKDS